MPLQFFKPNSKMTGSACAWSFNSSTRKNQSDPDGKAVFIEIIKQTSWNEETKTGSFKGGDKVNLKLSYTTELGGFIRVLKDIRDVSVDDTGKGLPSENQMLKSVHQGQNGTKSFSFIKSCYQSQGKKVIAYGLSISVSEGDKKDIFRISFDPNEAETLLNWLIYAQQHIFDGIYAEDKKIRQDYLDSKKNLEKSDSSTKKGKKITKEEPIEDPSGTDEEELF